MANILIIDDEPTLRMLMKNFLSRDGHFVAEAETGDEGIDLAKKSLPDLILLDVMMPGKNGYQVSLELKNDEITKNIPIILVTGTSQVTESGLKLEIAADMKLSKPFGKEELIEIVTKALKDK